MLDALKKVFRHRHHYEQAETIFRASSVNPASAVVGTAYVFRCKCGAEYRRITPAGEQQIGWGDDPQAVMGLV